MRNFRFIFSVVIVEHTRSAWIGEIAVGAAGDQVFVAASFKESGRFPGLRHDPVVVHGVLPGDGGVVVRQRGADHLEVMALKPDVGLASLFVSVQAEVAGIHVQGLIDWYSIRTRMPGCLGNTQKSNNKT